ncbi:MAG: hypothetical protein JNL44_12670 [Gemmatimonadetes bacterium]|nr:hypothetical protein [Gemmatimonadota bacterium]
MDERRRILLRRSLSVIAIAFGALTLFAGGRVLFLGVDPGYVVFRPLLVFNTTMGVVYLVAGLAFWRDARWSRRAAGIVLALNLGVLAAVVALHQSGAEVAIDSVRAMIFRSAIWAALFLGAHLSHRRNGGSP